MGQRMLLPYGQADRESSDVNYSLTMLGLLIGILPFARVGRYGSSIQLTGVADLGEK